MGHELNKFKKRMRNAACRGETSITIACLGDSVTQGVFEVDEGMNGDLLLTTDTEAVYHRKLKQLLQIFYPQLSFRVVNAGISGTKATEGLIALEDRVLPADPDLCIVCFGLNDSVSGLEGVEIFRQAIENILIRLDGIPVILLTPCMMNTRVSSKIQTQKLIGMAQLCAEIQSKGVFEAYVDIIRQISKKHNICICDEYAKYELWRKNGIDTDTLLSNHINHPLRDIHSIWAVDLLQLLL